MTPPYIKLYAALIAVLMIIIAASLFISGKSGDEHSLNDKKTLPVDSIQLADHTHQGPSGKQAQASGAHQHDHARLTKTPHNPANPALAPGFQRPVKKLNFENLSGYSAGDRIRIPLENGEFLIVRVTRIEAFNDEVINMVGAVEDNPEATFFTTFIGHVRIATQVTDPLNDIGYDILQENGTTTVDQKKSDEMLPVCDPFPADWVEVAGTQQVEDPEIGEIPLPLEDRDLEVGGSGGSLAVPLLSSKPNAPKVIYIDFDGEVVTETYWTYNYKRLASSGARGTPINAEAYSLDTNKTGFSNRELQEIYTIWATVAEEFSAFDVNVTTDVSAFNAVTYWNRHQHIVTSTRWYPAGGVAGIGSFRRSMVSWGFYVRAQVIAHEVGHTFGLWHDGTPFTTYYGGHGSGSLAWMPIMGSGSRPASWSKGEYHRANNIQDDLATINFYLNYHNDDHGNTNITANTFDARDSSKHYKIRVGDYYRGNYNKLFILSEDDPADADSTFSNIMIYEDGSSASVLNLNSYILSDYASHNNGGTGATIQNGGTALNIKGSVWTSINYSYTITENTILEFDFDSTVEGEAHAIGFDDDNNYSKNFAFQLAGDRAVGFTNFQKDDVTTNQYFGSLHKRGIIENQNDVDVFQYTSVGGEFTANAQSALYGNLDIKLELYDAGGSLLSSADPQTTRDAAITYTGSAGTNYYIHVSGTGIGDPMATYPTGYTDYASIGFYNVIVKDASNGNPLLPIAPDNLAATGVSTTQIDIGWNDNASNEDGYILECSADGVIGWILVAILPADTTSFSDDAYSSCMRIYYRVKAFNMDGESSWSNIDDGKTLGTCGSGTGIPEAPINLVAGSSSGNQIELSWVDNANNEDGFIVERSTDGVSGWTQIASLPSDSVSFSDSTVNQCEHWFYRVNAFNSSGSSDWSAKFSAVAFDIMPGKDWVKGMISTTTWRFLQRIIWVPELEKFTVVGSKSRIETSPDGLKWTLRKSGGSDSFTDIAWTGKKLVAVGRYGIVFTSPDGITWTKQYTGITNNLMSITWNGQQLVAVGYSGAIITSPDGITWTSRTSGTTDQIISATWTGKQFVAVSYGYGHVLTSPDGETWTLQTTLNKRLNKVKWVGTQLIAIGYSSRTGYSGAIITSPDGITWTSRVSSSSGYYLRNISWTGSKIIVATGYNSALSSFDGITWASEAGWYRYSLRSITWNGERFVGADGCRGTPYSTESCISPVTVPPLPPLNLTATGVGYTRIDVSWNDVATNEDGYILERSADGVNGWSQIGGSLPANTTLYDDTTVGACETWFYRVKAFNSKGASAWSNVDDGTTLCFPTTSISGVLWTMGRNHYSQLIDGTVDEQLLPIEVMSNVIDAAGGSVHSFYVQDDGSLWGVGRNNFGQLGDGTKIDQVTAIQIASDVVSVATSKYDVFYITDDDKLWGAGRNWKGELGIGHTSEQLTPVEIASNVKSVTTGVFHTAFVKNDSTLWVMGENLRGQLGTGSTSSQLSPVQIASNVKEVATGYFHTAFVKNDGTLWVTGSNDFGQLGNGSNTESLSPIKVENGVKSIAAGFHTTYFITTADVLCGMGHNSYEQLNNGTTDHQTSPVLIATSIKQVASHSSLIVMMNSGLSEQTSTVNRATGLLLPKRLLIN